MGGVWLVVRAEVRARWPALLGLVVIAAVVVGVVVGAAVGARRTQSTLDRYRYWSLSSDAAIQTETDQQADLLAARVRTLPYVEDAATQYLVNGFPQGADASMPDFAIFFDPHRRFGVSVDRMRVLAGRLPAADAPDEIALTELAAQNLHVTVGDHLHVSTWNASDLQALGSGGSFPGFHGPRLDLLVVGVGRTPDELQGNVVRDGLYGEAAPGFVAAHPGLAPWPPQVAVRLRHGSSDVAALRAAVNRFVGAPGRVEVDPATDGYQTSTQNAIDALSTALVVFALVAGAAGAVVVGQAISRQVSAAAGPDQVLRSLGLSQRARTTAMALPAVLAAVVGTVVGVGLSVAFSPLLPTGLARRAEIHPGVWFDPWGLAIGGLTAAVLLVGWAVLSAWRSQRDVLRTVRPRPSAAGNLLARWGLGLSAVAGTRFAFERGGRLSIPVRSAVVGATIAVAGIVGAGVMVSSLDSLVDSPPRWGWNWTTMPDAFGGTNPARTLAADPDLSAVATMNQVTVVFGSHLVGGYAMQPAKGSVTFTLLSGRLPSGPSEVALGTQSLADLHTSVGSTVRAVSRDGHTLLTLQVVGVVVPPPGQGVSPGVGAVFTQDGLLTVATEDVQPSIVLTYRNGADPAVVERRLSKLGLSFSLFARPQLPGSIRNVTQARSVAFALAGFFAVIGLAGLVHALTVSCRRRRPDFGVLCALGCRRRQICGIVVCQSLAITVIGLVVGVPLGLVAGRWVWGALVDQLGVVDELTTPWAVLALLAPVALLVAATVALAPARLAARVDPTSPSRR